MMDFPVSPTTGQIYDPGTGVRYRWNGSQWDVVTTGHAEMRNRIVNGAMQISQENGSNPVSASGSYPCDQWFMTQSGCTPQAVRSAPANVYLQSFSVVTASPAATAYCQNMQHIEGYRVADFLWGTADAHDAVLRFEARADIPGLYSVAIINAANDRSFIKGFQLTADWQTIEVAIPGEKTGVWAKDNTASLTVRFCTCIGANYVGAEGWQSGGAKLGLPGQVNVASQINKNLFFTNVGLYRDPGKTGKAPPFELPIHSEELQTCMRYWELIHPGDFIFSGSVTTGGTYYCGRGFVVPKRVSPAINLVNANAGSFPSAAGTLASSGPTHVMEGRVANGTAVGLFQTTVTANARM